MDPIRSAFEISAKAVGKRKQVERGKKVDVKKP